MTGLFFGSQASGFGLTGLFGSQTSGFGLTGLFGSQTSGFGLTGLFFGGQASGFGLTGFLFRHQIVDDHRLQLRGTLLQHHGRIIWLRQRRTAGIVHHYAGIGALGLYLGRAGRFDSGRCGGLGSGLGLCLIFLAAESQPGKQTFCHLINTHLIGGLLKWPFRRGSAQK